MAKVLSEAARQHQEAARQRVTWLLTNLFGGRQRRMAEATKMPQSQISRIVNGRLGVSPEFFDAMARLPGVNPDWARRGAGEPMMPPTRGTLPVALAVLPGPPLEYPYLLTGQRHPVAEALERETRYWLELQASSPLVRDPRLKLLPADLLLMETSPAWTTRLELIVGRLCGVRRGPDLAQPSYVLGRVDRDPLGLVLDLVDCYIRVSEQAHPGEGPEASAEAASSEPGGGPKPKRAKVKMRRKVRILEEEKHKAEQRQARVEGGQERQPAGGASSSLRIAVQEVVCVCVYVARPSPGQDPALAAVG